eukprot:10573249-Ditylum_brightwellii.AAC.1
MQCGLYKFTISARNRPSMEKLLMMPHYGIMELNESFLVLFLIDTEGNTADHGWQSRNLMQL